MALFDRVRTSAFDVGAFGYDLLTAQAYWREQIGRVLDFVPHRTRTDGLRVLDLGCGPGVSTFVLAQKLGRSSRFLGIDLAPNMIVRARHHRETRYPELDNVRFEQADATRLPNPDASFDLAVGHSFLYLVPDRPAVLREVHRVLAPGGMLVLMEPNALGSLPGAGVVALDDAGEAVRHPWQVSRFLTSMLLWRLFSAAAGRMSPELIQHLFHEAGFREVSTRPTLGGLGLHCIGSV